MHLDKKGQNIVGKVFLGFAAVVFIAVLLPVVQTFVGTSAGNLTADGADSGTIVLVNLLPFFLLLMTITALFIFDDGRR